MRVISRELNTADICNILDCAYTVSLQNKFSFMLAHDQDRVGETMRIFWLYSLRIKKSVHTI